MTVLFFSLILTAAQASMTCLKNQYLIQSFDELISSSGCASLALESHISANDFTICCDQRYICYQTCGLTKNYCDEDFRFCLHQLCETVRGVESSHQCEQLLSYLIHSTISSHLDEYEDYQTNHCRCLDAHLVDFSYQRFFKQFYSAHAPERAVKGLNAINKELSKADDQLGTYSKLFYQLHKKYENVISLSPQRRECLSYPRLGESWSPQS
jgi:hypothetical protein